MRLTARPAAGRGFSSLRRLVESKPPAVERCDLCSAVLMPQHQHLADPRERQLLCACDPCAILFSDVGETRYKRVPRDIWVLGDLTVGDALWSRLGIPAGLAFFFYSSAAARVMAFYPSPAGPAEAEVDADAWNELVQEWPELREIKADVEGLLMNRMRGAREYYIAPIDYCYQLSGLVRKYWRGLSGGDEAEVSLRDFFMRLRQLARPVRLQ